MKHSQPNSHRFHATGKRPCSPKRGCWNPLLHSSAVLMWTWLKGSKHGNMKELRFDAADRAWRAAFAFDALRQSVVLAAGDKAGGSQRRFYRALIAAADKRFDDHPAQQKKGV